MCRISEKNVGIVSLGLYNQAVAFTTDQAGDKSVNITDSEIEELDSLAKTKEEHDFVSNLRDKSNIAKIAVLGTQEGSSDSNFILSLDETITEETSLSIEVLKERYDFIKQIGFELHLNNPKVQDLVTDSGLTEQQFRDKAVDIVPDLVSDLKPKSPAAKYISELNHYVKPSNEKDSTHDAFIELASKYGSIQEMESNKSELINNLLDKITNNKFSQLPKETQDNLKSFLNAIPLKELLKSELQGTLTKEIDATNNNTGSSDLGEEVGSIIASLSELINTNRLTSDVSGAIKKLSEASFHPELEKQRLGLIRSSIEDIAFPERIAQHNKGTCAATSVQILFAIKDPQKYLNVVTELASNSGEVSSDLVKGLPKMKRAENTMETDDSGRSISNRLIQPAFMDFAMSIIKYNNIEDTRGIIDEGGLAQTETSRLANALMEGEYKNLSILTPKSLKKAKVEEALNYGSPVPCGLNWGDGDRAFSESGHEILVTKVDSDKNLAYFMNPWGELQTMPLNDFWQRLDTATVPKKPQDNPKVSAMSTLPGKASDPHNYEPLKESDYISAKDALKSIKGLTLGENIQIKSKFRKLDEDDLNPEIYSIIPILENPSLKPIYLEGIKKIKSEEQLTDFNQKASSINYPLSLGIISESEAQKMLQSPSTDCTYFTEVSNFLEDAINNKLLTKSEAAQVFKSFMSSPENSVSSIPRLINVLENIKKIDSTTNWLDLKTLKSELLDNLKTDKKVDWNNLDKFYSNLNPEQSFAKEFKNAAEGWGLNNDQINTLMKKACQSQDLDYISSLSKAFGKSGMINDTNNLSGLVKELSNAGVLSLPEDGVKVFDLILENPEKNRKLLSDLKEINSSIKKGVLSPDEGKKRKESLFSDYKT